MVKAPIGKKFVVAYLPPRGVQFGEKRGKHIASLFPEDLHAFELFGWDKALRCLSLVAHLLNFGFDIHRDVSAASDGVNFFTPPLVQAALRPAYSIRI
jgi:hypothetical protein